MDGGWDVSSQGVLVSKAREVWRRDVSNPEVIEGVDRGWDVSSQEVLGCEGVPRRRDVAAPEGVDMTADDADGTDKKERERMGAGMALSRTSDFASPVRRLAHPRNPRNPRSVLWPVTRRACFLGSARRTSAFRLRSRVRRPADHADGRRTRLRLGSHRLRSPERGSLYKLSFAAVESRKIAIHRD